jgi:hypothetical protein
MMTVARYKSGTLHLSHEKVKLVFGVLSAVCTGLAIVFKMTMELEVATIMLMAGASIFSFGFLPLHFFGIYRNSVA